MPPMGQRRLIIRISGASQSSGRTDPFGQYPNKYARRHFRNLPTRQSNIAAPASPINRHIGRTYRISPCVMVTQITRHGRRPCRVERGGPNCRRARGRTQPGIPLMVQQNVARMVQPSRFTARRPSSGHVRLSARVRLIYVCPAADICVFRFFVRGREMIFDSIVCEADQQSSRIGRSGPRRIALGFIAHSPSAPAPSPRVPGAPPQFGPPVLTRSARWQLRSAAVARFPAAIGNVSTAFLTQQGSAFVSAPGQIPRPISPAAASGRAASVARSPTSSRRQIDRHSECRPALRRINHTQSSRTATSSAASDFRRRAGRRRHFAA